MVPEIGYPIGGLCFKGILLFEVYFSVNSHISRAANDHDHERDFIPMTTCHHCYEPSFELSSLIPHPLNLNPN